MSILLKQPIQNVSSRTACAPGSEIREREADDWRKMPGHWMLARLGKRVLRPGGLELTRRLLDELNITINDEVVEFAPGWGIAERMTEEREPSRYTAVEREAAAAEQLRKFVSGPPRRCIQGSAEQTGLPNNFATVVYGEAMLSMQVPSTKERIVAEAGRLLRPGGRYGIHELCLVPEGLDQQTRESIDKELSKQLHVGVRLLTIPEWRELLERHGFVVDRPAVSSVRLLGPRRLVQDEGVLRALQFAVRMLGNRPARRRVLAMRCLFRAHRKHLAAVAIVGHKQ